MNLHEYQAKQLLRDYGVATPRGVVATDAALAESAAAALGGTRWIVKAQVHAGGRGKAGGVRLVQSIEELQAHAAQLLGKPLVTRQNAPGGQMVRAVLVEETLDIQREIYLSLTVDRERERIVLAASAAGGVEIEEIAQTDPMKILSEACDPIWGLQDFQCRRLAFGLGLPKEQTGLFAKLAKRLYRLFLDNDLSLLEINPLAVTGGGDLTALDCKIAVDDNALYRRQGLAELRDISQDDPKEAAAREAGLNYIALDGNIGCMVNGAGL
ncbi:MAG TPA: succinate--CoA ligase subunit beta, partial [Betaproteobacteria bacterium]|nr:succinate--CoA ligase subunit beta [Betaproteobacteria bacterium]